MLSFAILPLRLVIVLVVVLPLIAILLILEPMARQILFQGGSWIIPADPAEVKRPPPWGADDDLVGIVLWIAVATSPITLCCL